MLFLTSCTNTKQRMIRTETLIKRKCAERVVNNKEGPHRKWHTATLCGKTGNPHVESTDYLLILPMGTKVKNETKRIS